MLSVNLRNASIANAGIDAYVSVSPDGTTWHDGFNVLTWGTVDEDVPQPQPEEGQVEVDTLKLEVPARYVRYALTLEAYQPDTLVRRVALSAYDPDGSTPATEGPTRNAWGKTLPVPFVSQWNTVTHPAARVCSPSCVTMLGRFHGKDVHAEQIATLAYDGRDQIYGNWPANMLAISLFGLRACVDRGTAMRDLEAAIAAEKPVAASIAYATGELPGAPVEQTSGHLVVVAGFSESGDPVVRDPAARGDDLWITYPREAFARAWLAHGGVMYRIEPERE